MIQRAGQGQADGPARASGLPEVARQPGSDIRLPQRRDARRRSGTRAALPLSDARSQRHCDRLPGGVPRPLPAGWGGTQLLPRLIGPAAAVSVIIDNALNQNRMLRADQAARLGLVDLLLSDADFLAESLRWAARVVHRRGDRHAGEPRDRRLGPRRRDEPSWPGSATAQGCPPRRIRRST